MSTANAAEKSIVVRAVQRRRYTHTIGQTVRRTIWLNGPIQSSDLEVMKGGRQVILWIDEETPQTQVAIGFITADEEHREKLAPEIQLTLPQAAFTDFWNATNSTVTLKIDDAMSEITDVILSEGTPIHPLVAELNSMWRPLRLFMIGLFAAAWVFVALEIVRVIWVLWHGR
jgi:hypothetical protein